MKTSQSVAVGMPAVSLTGAVGIHYATTMPPLGSGVCQNVI
jgi:hypothetical protein